MVHRSLPLSPFAEILRQSFYISARAIRIDCAYPTTFDSVYFKHTTIGHMSVLTVHTSTSARTPSSRRCANKSLRICDPLPICRGAKPKHILPWDSLEPVPHPDLPLSILYFGFVEGLPLSTHGHDKLLTITCKSTKYIGTIPGTVHMTSEDWAEQFFIHIYGDWGLPDCIISDQDSKFRAGFWKRLFTLAKTPSG
jgi:hypothetical protein